VTTLGLLLRVELRRRWRAWLLLAMLVGLVSGLVTAGVAAGRRTDSAYPRFVQAYGFDADAFAPSPIPGVAKLSDVSTSTLLRSPAAGTPTCSCGHLINANDFGLAEISPKKLGTFVKLVSGRLPDQTKPDEVLASFTFQKDVGVRVGSRIRVPLYARSQRTDVLTQSGATPKGPTVTLRIVGIEAADIEFQSSSYPYYDLYTTAAFDRAINPRAFPVATYFVRLRHGAQDLPRFQTEARTHGALSVTDLDTTTMSNESSIHPQALGWWLLAAVMALVGVVLIVQALARQAIIESEAYATLSALGVSRRQFVSLGILRSLVIAALGAAGGVVLAVLLSPLTPVGEARVAEPSTGFAVDPLVLLLGAVVAVMVIIGAGLRPALQTARPRRRSDDVSTDPSHIVGTLSRNGAPASTLIGVERAVQRGRGSSAVPVGSAIIGVVLAVIALAATAVFGSSLGHLTTTPSLYGQPFDAWFSADNGPNATGSSPVEESLLANGGISSVTAGFGSDITINGHTVDAIGGNVLKGRLLFTAISGRLPRRADEVTLGAATMRQAGAHVGSTVRVRAPSPTGGVRDSSYRVVGTSAFPPDFGAGGLGTGAIFSKEGLLETQCASGPSRHSCVGSASGNSNGVLLVKVMQTPSGRHALAALAAKYPALVEFPMAPNDLVNFGQAVNFPLILSVVIILFGVAALLHVLLVSVSRRRRESAVLKAIGFVRRQVALTVVWQSMTIGIIGVLVGVPVGAVIGRLAWQTFAEHLGVVPLSVVDGWSLGAIAIGTLAMAGVLSVWPALVAVRSHAASRLRSE
jgi:ABC-type lipoprotein release transport system permease subunit